MVTQKVATAATGIRTREHPSRRHGLKPDKCFYARYKIDGRLREESLGWSSEGMTLKKAVAIRSELRLNHIQGKGHRSLAEARELDRQRREAEEQAKIDAAKAEERAVQTIYDNVFTRFMDDRTDISDKVNLLSRHRKWVSPFIGQKNLDDILLIDLERIKRAMLKEGRSLKTISNVKGLIRLVFNHASLCGLFSGEAPTRHFLKRVKKDNRRQRYLEPAEASALLGELKRTSIVTYRLALVSLSTGMRFGEIVALRWMHLTGDTILIVDPKNGTNRYVPMTKQLRALFDAMRTELPLEKEKARRRNQLPVRGASPDDLIFPPRKRDTKAGVMVSVPKAFVRAVNAVGLNDGISDRRLRIVFHSLRHSAASWMVNAGVEIPVIARILGHKTLQMTMRYAHVGDRAVENAIDKLSLPAEQSNVLDFQRKAEGDI